MEHKAWHHFCTITQHKLLVMQNCFRVGLYKQGLLHDLSKYSPAEFLTGVHYYQGDRSPNAAEREEKGYSTAWLHHKGRNKHHFEYWMDFSKTSQGIAGAKMPVNYLVEMVMDLESELGVELDMEDQKITTFQELADFVESKLN